MKLIEVKAEKPGLPFPLLLVHGAWHGAWCWEPFMHHLAGLGITSYAFDLPGHGERLTEGAAGRGIPEYTAVLAEAVAQLAPQNPVLVGHSMGGLIVQKYLEARNAPAAVLVAPCPAMGGGLDLFLKYGLHHPADGLAVTLGRLSRVRNPKMCHRLFFYDVSPENLRAAFRRLVPESCRAIRQMVFPGFKVKAAPPKPGTPVLVVSAGHDYFFPPALLEKWSKPAGFDYLTFPDSGHNLFMEPALPQFADQVLAWITDRVEAASEGPPAGEAG
ncbi:MAG: alpha/beta hydrolase [Proteobacteria bacterium]|nr:alpha/beta hydrolase [Pseudomonadota bacterium]